MSNVVSEQRDRSALVDRVNRRLLWVVIVSLLIVLVGGGLAAFVQYSKGTTVSHARPADMSVVGPPTLSAATINSIFANAGSPMAGTGALIEQTSRATNVDDAFAMGVWWAETNDGMAGVGDSDRNPGSVRGNAGFPVAADGYTLYPSYSSAITDWFHLIQHSYVGQGLTTVYSISTSYVGTSGASSWAAKVISYEDQYRGQAPPPTSVTATPTPKPKPPRPVIVPRRVNIVPSNPVRHPQPVTDPGQKNMAQAAPVLVPDSVHKAASKQTASAPSPHGLSGITTRLMISGGLLAALLIFFYALWLERRTKRLSLIQAWAQSRVPFEGSQSAAPLVDGQVPTGTLQSPAFAVAKPEDKDVFSPAFLSEPQSSAEQSTPDLAGASLIRSATSGGLLRRYKFTIDNEDSRDA